MKILNTTTARRIKGAVVAEPDLTRVLVPIVSPKMIDGRAVLQVTGTVEAEPGAAVGKYLGATGFVTDPSQATNIRGVEGKQGSSVKGDAGYAGWTPVLAGENDGVRTLIKVADWTGGSGDKPAAGMYLGTAGYVASKAEAFNFNASKRVRFYQAVTAANGIATINYTAEKFTTPPVIIPLQATTAGINGTARSSLVAASVTATQAQIKVEVQALITGALTALLGATVNALVIES